MENRGKILQSSSLGFIVKLDNGEIIVAKTRKGREYTHGDYFIIGDNVLLDSSNQIKELIPRNNLMQRPRIANIDQAGIIISAKEPDFKSYLLDKFLTAAFHSNIPAFIIISKMDLLSNEERNNIIKRLDWYRKLDYKIYLIGKEIEDDTLSLKELLSNKTSFVMGQTGVGKSSLINKLDSKFTRSIGNYNKNYGRGQHKTKEVILLPFLDGYIADTPGFSGFDLNLTKKELALEFPGYQNYAHQCKFLDCLHNSIKGCAIEQAVENNELSRDSYNNYLKLLFEDALK